MPQEQAQKPYEARTRSRAYLADTGSKVHNPKPRRQRTRRDEVAAAIEEDLAADGWDWEDVH